MISLVYIKIFHYINVSIHILWSTGFTNFTNEKIPCLSILFSEKPNEQQPKQQETEENQYNPFLNITDFLLEVNKIVIFETPNSIGY